MSETLKRVLLVLMLLIPFSTDATGFKSSVSIPPTIRTSSGENVSCTAGIASYYHNSLSGRPTASGEPYRPTVMTAAHRTLRLGSRVTVRNIRTGRMIEVRINDRGPFVRGRIIDLSRTAAESLGIINSGVGSVEVCRL